MLQDHVFCRGILCQVVYIFKCTTTEKVGIQSFYSLIFVCFKTMCFVGGSSARLFIYRCILPQVSIFNVFTAKQSGCNSWCNFFSVLHIPFITDIVLKIIEMPLIAGTAGDIISSEFS